MKVGIIHHTLNSCGGGEYLSLTLAEALKSIGCKVVYYTTQKTDWRRVAETLGIAFKPDCEKSVFKVKIPYFGIYQRLIHGVFNNALKECDLVVNTHGDVMPFAKAHITYMHYPTFSLWYENPANVKYLKSAFWKIYFTPYFNVQRKYIRKIHGIILTNSKFSREAIRKHVGRKAYVVYPPVDVEKYLPLLSNDKRENTVVTIGRFTPEKNYEKIVEIASKLPNISFAIIGAVTNKLNRNYYCKIQHLIEKLRLKNVKLYPNLPFKEKLKLLGEAKIYLHAMVNEHFGISIVEAIASGLAPVVHRSGGPWKDILEEKHGTYGYSFTTANEAVKAIKNLVENEKLRKRIVANNLKRIRVFSKKRFKKQIICICKHLLAKVGKCGKTF